MKITIRSVAKTMKELREEVKNINVRLEVYEHILNQIRYKEEFFFSKFGMCFCFPKRFEENFHYKILISLFPELRAKKPKIPFGGGYWFDPYQAGPRIKLLEEVIKETKQKMIIS